MWVHPAPMFSVIVVGPFTKWGIDSTLLHVASFIEVMKDFHIFHEDVR
jgi:hypothetical protein